MTLMLHDRHSETGATFGEVNGSECVASFGDASTEFTCLAESAALLDLGFRSRLCVTGADRVEFLHGQVTNNVKSLAEGEGCYAALVDHKGKIQSDLNIYRLKDELLLDFEPGLTERVTERLEKFIIAEDVDVIDVAPHYGLLSVQGPKSGEAIECSGLVSEIPHGDRRFVSLKGADFGEAYLANRPRMAGGGFDVFVPNEKIEAVWEALNRGVEAVGGFPVGWAALEAARIEAGIPRYGVDMTETNLAPETGIGDEAISYNKGCYIGQEVIARIRTYGRVSKSLRRLRFVDDPSGLPIKDGLLYDGDRKVGNITSVVQLPTTQEHVAIGYVRRESNEPGAALTLRTDGGECGVKVMG
ncbi:MAG: folate-binding protein YgfZ [Candidatus Binatia bacterium]|jgi:folate-binding protein YgfZ